VAEVVVEWLAGFADDGGGRGEEGCRRRVRSERGMRKSGGLVGLSVKRGRKKRNNRYFDFFF